MDNARFSSHRRQIVVQVSHARCVAVFRPLGSWSWRRDVEPVDQVQGVPCWIRLEFQRMVTFEIFDRPPVRRRQRLKVGECCRVVDDPILTGQHQQGRLPNSGGCPPDPSIDEEAGGE